MNKFRINERAYLKVKDITGNTINNIEVIEMDNGFCYYSKRLFGQKFGMSERTMQRREAKIRGKIDYWRYCIPFQGYKIFYSVAILGINKRNLIGRARSEYLQFLSMFEWDIIGTVRPDDAKTISSVRNVMNGLNNALKKRYKDHAIGSYNFNIDANTSSYGNNRFDLVFYRVSTGLELDKNKKSVFVYPNPAKDLIYFSSVTNSASEIKVSLLNIQGQLIYEEYKTMNSDNSFIKLDDLSPGIYFLKFEGEYLNETHKIIKR